MDRWQYDHYTRHFILFLRQKVWLPWQQIYIKKSENGGISYSGGAGRGLISYIVLL